MSVAIRNGHIGARMTPEIGAISTRRFFTRMSVQGNRKPVDYKQWRTEKVDRFFQFASLPVLPEINADGASCSAEIGTTESFFSDFNWE